MAKAEGPSREPAREARRLFRKERRHAEHRTLILAAARRLLVRRGIEGFTVSAVASVAEVSKPAVYYYFESKEDLVTALAVEVLLEETSTLRQVVASALDPSGVLPAMGRAYVTFHLADLERFRILHVWPHALGLGARLGRTDAHAGREVLDEEVARLLRRRSDAERLVRVTRALAHGLVCAASGDDQRPPSATAVADLCEAACRAVWAASTSG